MMLAFGPKIQSESNRNILMQTAYRQCEDDEESMSWNLPPLRDPDSETNSFTNNGMVTPIEHMKKATPKSCIPEKPCQTPLKKNTLLKDRISNKRRPTTPDLTPRRVDMVENSVPFKRQSSIKQFAKKRRLIFTPENSSDELNKPVLLHKDLGNSPPHCIKGDPMFDVFDGGKDKHILKQLDLHKKENMDVTTESVNTKLPENSFFISSLERNFNTRVLQMETDLKEQRNVNAYHSSSAENILSNGDTFPTPAVKERFSPESSANEILLLSSIRKRSFRVANRKLNRNLLDESKLDVSLVGMTSLEANLGEKLSLEVNILEKSSPEVNLVEKSSPEVNFVEKSCLEVSLVEQSSLEVNLGETSSPEVSLVEKSSPAIMLNRDKYSHVGSYDVNHNIIPSCCPQAFISPDNLDKSSNPCKMKSTLGVIEKENIAEPFRKVIRSGILRHSSGADGLLSTSPFPYIPSHSCGAPKKKKQTGTRNLFPSCRKSLLRPFEELSLECPLLETPPCSPSRFPPLPLWR